MKISITFILLIIVCAFPTEAQIFTPEYLALADSADPCIKKEKWPEAEHYIRKALKTEPANKSNYLMWANLGMVCSYQNNHRGALEAYTIGLSTAPRSTSLLTNRAASYLAVGLNREALEDLTTALEVDSTLQRARKLRGITLATLDQGEKALQDFDKYEADFGEDATIADLRGNIMLKKQQPVEALKYFKKSYRLEPEESTALKLLTTAYLSGHLEEERDILEECIKKYERNGNFYLLRAALNRMLYQTSAMESDLKTAQRLGADKRLSDMIFK